MSRDIEAGSPAAAGGDLAERYAVEEPDDDFVGQDEFKKPDQDNEPAETDDDKARSDDADADEEVDDLVRDAEQLGFSKEEIAGFGQNRKGLEAAMKAVARRAANFRQSSPQNQENRKETPAPESKDKTEFGIDLNPDFADPEVVAQFKKLHEHYGKQIQALNQRLEGVSGAMRQRDTAEVNEWFNASVAKLGEEYQELFGDTNAAPDSSQGKAREALRRQLLIQAAAYSDSEQKPSRDVIFRQAFRIVAGDHAEKIARRKLEADLKRHNAAALGRGGRKGGDRPKNPDRSAEDFATEFMRKRGFNVDASEDDTEEI